jgi:putative ABC transport system ATP-binding protein
MGNSREPREPVFHARGLKKIYQSTGAEVAALRGVDLDLFPGEFVVILGPSGSGKSTLLNILGGLDSASEGEVYYRDHNLVGASPEELTRFRREHVGFVFQFYNLISSLTADENVRLVTEIAENPMDPIEALRWVGMEKLAGRFPSELSGGEQQRVAIARAVSKRPDILLCDEPTGALDVETGRKVIEAILKVNRELGTLSVVITHNSAIAGVADRVVRLASGGISEVIQNPRKIPVSELAW